MGENTEKLIARCTSCSNEFSKIDMEGKSACPSCGTKAMPMSISDDVNVKINWHELRILVIWSENWARQMDKDNEDTNDEKTLLAIMTIAERLQKQYPDKTKLTLFSEIRELRKDYEIESNLDNDKDLI